MHYDESLLPICRNLVETKLGWGDSSQWSTGDFEALGERIFAETGVSLSASTLKRLWGRVRYTSAPQVATLNALALFVGYQSFRDFESAQKNADAQLKAEPAINFVAIHDAVKIDGASPKKSGKRVFAIGLGAGIVLSLLLAFSLTINQNTAIRKAHPSYTFSGRPVSEGIPNSVVFTFDVSRAETDCLSVQQSWDPQKRFSIRKDQKQATSIYYYPGFYKAKLIVGDSAVKQHNLLIKTTGWLPLVDQQPVPVYFKPTECTHDGKMELTAQLLASRNVPLQPTVPWVSFRYVQDMGTLSSENFTLETRLRSTYSTGSGACQHTQVIVLCENTAISIPMAIPGCTSAINARFADKVLKGTENDLSALGVNFSDFVKLRIQVKNKSVQVSINDEPALKSAFSSDAGKVIGFVYRFKGTGSVDYLHVYDQKGKEVLVEDF